MARPEQGGSFRPDIEPQIKETGKIKLENLLQGERAGSIKVVAISDHLQRVITEHSLRSARMSGDTEIADQLVVRLALIDEKIRERQIGENADEYIDAYERFETEVFPLYYDQESAQRRRQNLHTKFVNAEDFDQFVTNSAAQNA